MLSRILLAVFPLTRCLAILFPERVENPQQQKTSFSSMTGWPRSKMGLLLLAWWKSPMCTDMAREQQVEYRHLVQQR